MPTASHFTQCKFNLAWPRIGHRRPRQLRHLAITGTGFCMRCLILILCCAMSWSWGSWGSWWSKRDRGRAEPDDEDRWGKWGPDGLEKESKDSFTVILLKI